MPILLSTKRSIPQRSMPTGRCARYMASKLGSSPSELPPLLKQKLDNLTDSTLSDVKRVATLSGVLYFVTTVAHPKKEELETNHLVFTCLPSFLIISNMFSHLGLRGDFVRSSRSHSQSWDERSFCPSVMFTPAT